MSIYTIHLSDSKYTHDNDKLFQMDTDNDDSFNNISEHDNTELLLKLQKQDSE